MPFPVSCPACGKSFSIADDAYEQKIKGRVVSVKCKQCQTLIRVDGTRPLAAGAGASNAPAHPGLAFLVDTPGATDRELTGSQIAAEIQAGRMTEASLVWREGMEEWTEAGKVKELASFLKPPAPAPESARPPRIRPMQPTLPMGMMAPPSLAARGITLPLSPAGGRPTQEAQSAVPVSVALEPLSRAPAPSDVSESSRMAPVEDGRELVGDSMPPLDSMPPEPTAAPPAAPPPPSGELSWSPARPAPRAAMPKPGSAPRASAVPIPTPLPRSARGSSPLTSGRPLSAPDEPFTSAPPLASIGAPSPNVSALSLGAGPMPAPGAGPVPSAAPARYEQSYPGAYPLQSAAPVHSVLPGQGGRMAASSFPTAPAPPGVMPQQSMAPFPPNAMPSVQSSPPVPFPASFPKTAPLDDLDFRPKRNKTVVIAVLLAVAALVVIGIVAANSGGAPVPVPVPPAVPTAEPTPTATPTPTPTSAPNAAPANPGADPLSAPAAPPKTGNDFTDLFAAGAKKLGTAKPAASATPPE